MEWFKIDTNRRKTIIGQTSSQLGIPEIAIEKDFWISVLLKIIFESQHGDHLLFKGGTSLSKGWKLIDRFSEDIDLAISPGYLGFDKLDSKRSIERLREDVYKFTLTTLKDDIRKSLVALGISEDAFNIYPEKNQDEKEPVSLILEYNSMLDIKNDYVLPRVKIELSGRSLKEPFEEKQLNSLMFESYENIQYVNIPSKVKTVLPQRTFLEKIFLLHEEFNKEAIKIRHERMSRHLYDIYKIYDRYGNVVLDLILFETIKSHRAKISPIKGTDYETLTTQNISFLPEDSIYQKYKEDYKSMFENMIYDLNKPGWEKLFESLMRIQNLINLGSV